MDYSIYRKRGPVSKKKTFTFEYKGIRKVIKALNFTSARMKAKRRFDKQFGEKVFVKKVLKWVFELADTNKFEYKLIF
jgi:hypothetical protein